MALQIQQDHLEMILELLCLKLFPPGGPGGKKQVHLLNNQVPQYPTNGIYLLLFTTNN